MNEALSANSYKYVKHIYEQMASQPPKSDPALIFAKKRLSLLLQTTTLEDFLSDYEAYECAKHKKPIHPSTILAIRTKIGLGLMMVLLASNNATDCWLPPEWRQPFLVNKLYHWTCRTCSDQTLTTHQFVVKIL